MQNKSLFPKFISIQTTSVCNAGCIFCPSTQIKGKFPAKAMDEQLFQKIIDECKNYRGIERIILYLNNEPLTDRDIVKRINYAKKNVPWASVHILTNGSLLSSSLQDELINSKLDWIGISFHGIKKSTIEKTMKVDYDSTFERINQFIDKAKKKRRIEDFIMITFLKHQFLSNEEKEQAISFWKERGIKRISFFEAPISRAGNVNGIAPVHHQGIAGCQSIWADEMIHITENGSVILCCMDWRREVTLGNLKTNTIQHIWNSNLYNQARLMRDGMINSTDDFICKRCESAIPSRKNTTLTKEIIPLSRKPEILLVVAPMWATDMPPLGVSCLSAYLEKNDISVDILDINIKLYNHSSDEKKMLWDMQKYNYWADDEIFFKYTRGIFANEITDYAKEIFSSGARIIGFSLYGTNNLISIEIAKELKKLDPDIFIVFGGPACYWLAKNSTLPSSMYCKNEGLLFSPGLVDVFVRGEGEVVLKEIILAFRKKDFSQDIPGTIIYRNGNYFEMPGRPPLTNLDTLPIPDFHKLALDLYKTRTLPIMMSRGCVRRCNFCNDHAMRNSLYSCRSAENVFKQILQLKSDFGVIDFQFVDLLINGNLRVLEELCDLLIKNNIGIKWTAQAIIRKEMNGRLFRKMRRSGCLWLTFGVESFSNTVLEKMGKPYTAIDAKRNLMKSKKAGIKNSINLIIGFCGENDVYFDETLAFLRKYHHLVDMVSSLNACCLNAGTQISINPEKFLIKPSADFDRWFNWESTDRVNNYPKRKENILKTESLLHKLSIPISFIGLYPTKTKEINEIEVDLDLLLVTLPPWGVENPPIGLGYLDGYCQKNNFRTKVCDLNIRFYNSAPSEYKMLWHVENKNFWSNKETFPQIKELFDKQLNLAADQISRSLARYIGFSVVDPKERITIELIKRIKKIAPEKKIIIGGPVCSTSEQRDLFETELKGDIDFFVVGEGEETLCEILRKDASNRPAEQIGGTALKRNGAWSYIERPLIEPLDAASFPDYKSFDLNQYESGNSMLVEWSRGCKGHCSFCKNFRLVKGYRFRSADSIYKELCFLKENHEIENFTVCDNLMNGNPQQLEEVSRLISKGNLRFSWSGQIAPSVGMRRRLFSKMRKAGCFKVQVGVESGSSLVLQKMKKLYTPELAQENIKAAKKAGMHTEIFLLVGFPGETEKEFRSTLNFIKNNARYIGAIKSINTLHLIAGTEIYERPSEFNLKTLPKDNWHYLWETTDGNTYAERKKRVEMLLDLAAVSGITVMETNINEGKEATVTAANSLNTQMALSLKESLNCLQRLPCSKQMAKKTRNAGKWIILSAGILLTAIYIFYFWFSMIIRNRLLLGGRKN